MPEVKNTRSQEDQITEFYKVSLTNKEPDYDIGLKKSENVPEENNPNESNENLEKKSED